MGGHRDFATSFPIFIATPAPAALVGAQGKIRARDGRGDALPSRDADRAEPGVRDGDGGGALRRPATIRQSNLAQGGESRDVESKFDRNVVSGLALWRANVTEESRLHRLGGAHARPGYWREHNAVYGFQRRGAERIACEESGQCSQGEALVRKQVSRQWPVLLLVSGIPPFPRS